MSQPSRTIVVEPVQVSMKAPAPAESRVEPPASAAAGPPRCDRVQNVSRP